jgi:hypothetical protein
MIGAERVDSLPALRGLLLTLLLAETVPPADAGPGAALLTARIDKLLDMGALDQARALLDAAGSRDPDLFRRSFDVALLTGEEDRGCRIMVESPGLAPTFPARIFCLARSGDWNAAALTIRTSRALGQITEAKRRSVAVSGPRPLRGRAGAPCPRRPGHPADWMIYSAIGEPCRPPHCPSPFPMPNCAPGGLEKRRSRRQSG